MISTIISKLKVLAVIGGVAATVGLWAQPAKAEDRLRFSIGVGGYVVPTAPYYPAPYAVNSYVYPPVVYNQDYYSSPYYYYPSPNVVYQAAPQVYYYNPPVYYNGPSYYYSPGVNLGFGIGFGGGGFYGGHGGGHGGGGHHR